MRIWAILPLFVYLLLSGCGENQQSATKKAPAETAPKESASVEMEPVPVAVLYDSLLVEIGGRISFNSDGTQGVFSDGLIRLLDMETRQITTMGTPPYDSLNVLHYDFARFSPSGERVLFTELFPRTSRVGLYDLKNDKYSMVTYRPGKYTYPNWFGSNDELLFNHVRTQVLDLNNGVAITFSDLYYVDLRSDKIEMIVSIQDGPIYNLRVWPEPRKVMYSLKRGRYREQMLESEFDSAMLAFSLTRNLVRTEHSVSAADYYKGPGAVVVVMQKKGRLSDLYLLQRREKKLFQLTDTPKISEIDPAWMPGSNKIAYTRVYTNEEKIALQKKYPGRPIIVQSSLRIMELPEGL